MGRMLVIPSRAESLPYVVLEAAAAGLPIIATDVGGVPEIFGPQAAQLIPPDDIAALIGAITAAIDDPARDASARQALGNTGAQRVLVEHDGRMQPRRLSRSACRHENLLNSHNQFLKIVHYVDGQLPARLTGGQSQAESLQ